VCTNGQTNTRWAEVFFISFLLFFLSFTVSMLFESISFSFFFLLRKKRNKTKFNIPQTMHCYVQLSSTTFSHRELGLNQQHHRDIQTTITTRLFFLVERERKKSSSTLISFLFSSRVVTRYSADWTSILLNIICQFFSWNIFRRWKIAVANLCDKRLYMCVTNECT